MKYDVVHRCGHGATVNLVGPGKERDRKLDYLSRILCRACEKAETERKLAIQSAEAREWAEAEGLEPIHGTPAQAAWAERIRRTIIQEAYGLPERSPSYGVFFDVRERFGEFVRYLFEQTDARFWIDGRDVHPDEADLWRKIRISPCMAADAMAQFTGMVRPAQAEDYLSRYVFLHLSEERE